MGFGIESSLLDFESTRCAVSAVIATKGSGSIEKANLQQKGQVRLKKPT